MTTTRRWAVVLGVSTGTGAAIARALAREPGLSVFGIHRGRHQAEADAVARAVRDAGGEVHFRIGDAASPEAVSDGVAELLEVAGHESVQMFVHSLADGSVARFVRGGTPVHPKQLRKTFEVMAHSFVYWVQALVDGHAMAPGGRLLGLTNPLIATPLHGCGVIAASKAALEVYVRYLAVELGREGLRVNLLNFGAVETPAFQMVTERQDSDSLAVTTAASSPSGRLASVDEVARFVSVLASDAGRWFHGATIDFTGGEWLGHYNALVYGSDRE